MDKIMGEGEGDEQAQEWVPRAIFTRDAKPDMSKFQIPRLRLAQGMTPEVTERKANIGQFLIPNFPPVDELIVVPFACQLTRAYRPDPKGRPVCSAPTGVFGYGTPGGVCDECPLSKWGAKDPATGKSMAPKCGESFEMRAYSITHNSMIDYGFKSRDLSRGSFIAQQAMAFGYGNFAVRVTSETTSNNKGSWYIPRLEMLTSLPEDQKEIVAKWFAAFWEATPTAEEANLTALAAGS
jgi:hypothetical protein